MGSGILPRIRSLAVRRFIGDALAVVFTRAYLANVLVDAQGKVASELAAGAPAVLALAGQDQARPVILEAQLREQSLRQYWSQDQGIACSSTDAVSLSPPEQ